MAKTEMKGYTTYFSSLGVSTCPACKARMMTVGPRHMCRNVECRYQQSGDVVEYDPRVEKSHGKKPATQRLPVLPTRTNIPPSPDERGIVVVEEDQGGPLPATEQVLEIILLEVAREFGLTKEEVLQFSKRLGVLQPRRITAMLMLDLAKASTTMTGDFLGRRNHTTIIRSAHHARQEMEDDDVLKGRVFRIRHAIRKAYADATHE